MSDSPIERENLTAALVRDHDDEALVGWILGLQDHGEALEAEVERLQGETSANQAMLFVAGRAVKELKAEVKRLTARVGRLEQGLSDLIYSTNYRSKWARNDAIRVARLLLDPPEPTEALRSLMQHEKPEATMQRVSEAVHRVRSKFTEGDS